MIPSECRERDEDPAWSLVDGLTLVSRACLVVELIAFSSSPLLTSPSERDQDGRRLILPIVAAQSSYPRKRRPASRRWWCTLLAQVQQRIWCCALHKQSRGPHRSSQCCPKGRRAPRGVRIGLPGEWQVRAMDGEGKMRWVCDGSDVVKVVRAGDCEM